jgi:hypothetical protein
MILLKAMIDQTILEVAGSFPWPELEREYTFTLSTSTASYALPPDYDSRQNLTLWNRTQARPLIGPVDAVAWQTSKSGLVASLPDQRFRVKGWTDTQFFIDPTPTSGENGQTCVFEYISRTTIRPITWAASLVFGANTYCSYNGNIYKTTAGGTAGSTAPTHTTGSASDGTVTWVYQTAAFESFTLDTNEVILDNSLIIDGAVWRFKRERGLDYEALQKEAEDNIEISKTRLLGADVISYRDDGQYYPVLGLRNYPQQDF